MPNDDVGEIDEVLDDVICEGDVINGDVSGCSDGGGSWPGWIGGGG